MTTQVTIEYGVNKLKFGNFEQETSSLTFFELTDMDIIQLPVTLCWSVYPDVGTPCQAPGQCQAG